MTETEAIVAHEHAIAAAHVGRDVPALDRLYHPDFVVVQPEGSLKTKEISRGDAFDYAARFLSVWVREQGTWLNLAYQAVAEDGA